MHYLNLFFLSQCDQIWLILLALGKKNNVKGAKNNATAWALLTLGTFKVKTDVATFWAILEKGIFLLQHICLYWFQQKLARLYNSPF